MTTILLINTRCVYHDLGPVFDCSSQKIKIVIKEKNEVTSCEIMNGFLRVEASGSESFRYKINKEPFQENDTFRNLSSGKYWVSAQSKEGCVDSLEVDFENFNSDLKITVSEIQGDSECLESNGSLKVGIENGIPPFLLYLDEQLIPQSLQIQKLNAGTHDLYVLDSNGCEYNLTVSIPHLYTGISWKSEIKPIIDRSCAKSGCHGINSSRARLTTYPEVKANAANIKSKTQNGSMPYDGPLPQNEVDLIACWVDDGALEN